MKCMDCSKTKELSNCPYCYEEYCENCCVPHAENCEPERDKFL